MAPSLPAMLNQPASLLVASAAAVKLASLDINGLTLDEIKLRFLVSFFVINLGSVSWPGRLDGELAQQISNEKNLGKPVKLSPLAVNGGRTLVAPAPWAFAIWGVIYLLETVSVISISFLNPLKATPALYTLLGELTPYFFVACCSQALWCCSFRSKYVTGSFFAKSLSTIYLTSTSISLSKVHALVTARRSSLTRQQVRICAISTTRQHK